MNMQLNKLNSDWSTGLTDSENDRKRYLGVSSSALHPPPKKKAKRSLLTEEKIRRPIVQETSSIPFPSTGGSPDEYLRALVVSMFGFQPTVRKSINLNNFFPKITEAQIAAYDMQIVSAARENNFDKVKAHYLGGNSLDCCNRFGESLLHMACRRGFLEMGSFLLEDAGLSVRIRDDCGRNPFHDICWNHTPNLELAEKVLQRDPALLLLSDKRGHSPFQYARTQDWGKWRQFLFDQREHLKGLDNEEARKIFSE